MHRARLQYAGMSFPYTDGPRTVHPDPYLLSYSFPLSEILLILTITSLLLTTHYSLLLPVQYSLTHSLYSTRSMTSTRDELTANWLNENTRRYTHPDTVYTHVLAALDASPSLRVKSDVYSRLPLVLASR